MDGGDLDGLLLRQRREQPRHPLGQHRFADPGRPGQHQMMRAGGGDLHRDPRRRLPDQIREVAALRRHIGRRVGDPSRQLPLSAEPALQLAQGLHAPHVDTVHQAGLGQIVDGHHHRLPAIALGGQDGGQHTVDRSHPAVEREFAEQHRLLQPRPRLLQVCRQHRRGQGQVIHRTHLGQCGRRQRQRQPGVRPRVAAVGDRRPNPITGFLQCGVGQPHQVHARQPAGDIGLDLHRDAVQTADRDGEGASQSHQPTACRWVSSGVRARPNRTPITSMRTPAQLPPPPASHNPASRRSRRTLSGVTA
ncbi:hypothetical protein MYFR107205_25125 [Mycolicibacterium frederiksbergense]